MMFEVLSKDFAEIIAPVVSVSQKGVKKDFLFENVLHFHVYEKEREEIDGKERIVYTLKVSSFGGVASTYIEFNSGELDLVKPKKEGEILVNTIDFVSSINSFEEDRKLVVESINNSLKISLKDDPDQSQSISSLNEKFSVQKSFNEDNKIMSARVHKDMLERALSSVFWAVGFESARPEYMTLCLKIEPKKIIAEAGTGAIFTSWQLDSDDDVSSIDGDNKIFFNRGQIPLILDLLKYSDDYVTVSEYESPDRICINFGNFSLLVSISDTILKEKWPKLEKILSQEERYSVSIGFKDLELATKGIMASYSSFQKKEKEILYVNVKGEKGGSNLEFVTEGYSSSKRKVPVREVLSDSLDPDGCSEQNVFWNDNKFNPRFLAKHFEDILKNSIYKKENPKMTVKFLNMAVILDFPPKQNDHFSATESISVFFARMENK